MPRSQARSTWILALAATACAGRAAAPVAPTDAPRAPAVPAVSAEPRVDLVLEASWVMIDRRPDPACEDDSRGVVRVDATTHRLSFAVCGGAKTVIDRALDPREAAAVAELVARVDRAPSSASEPPPSRCPRIRWRDASGTHESDPRSCAPSAFGSESAFALSDLTALLGGFRSDHACGGPRSLGCPGDAPCGMRDGLVPYAFGKCAAPSVPGLITLSCQAIAYCPKGWREPTEENACQGKAGTRCRFVSAGCDDETLCMKCGPAESCPGGPPLPP